jgi:hypothetical protein
MGWQPGLGSGTGASPEPGKPGGVPFRDPRLRLFASEDGADALVPSKDLAAAVDEVSGLERRCPGASGDELVGLARAWAGIESWAASGKLGVVAEMIRRDDAPRKPGGWHGDLPDEWTPSLRHELALALASSVQSAETTIWLAWELQARLPGTGGLLAGGTLTAGKARAIVEAFKYLTDADAARAEALILDQLAGKTYPQVLRLAEQAALTVDPGLAERRRQQAERSARVTLFRELQGTAALSGRDLPPDQALAAMAGVNARAQRYEDSGAFGATPMDALRAYAYLDLLTGTPAEERIACAVALDPEAEIAEAVAWANARAARAAAPGDTGPGTGTTGRGTGTWPAAGPGPAHGAGQGSGTESGGQARPGSGPATGAKPGTGGPGARAGTRTRPAPHADPAGGAGDSRDDGRQVVPAAQDPGQGVAGRHDAGNAGRDGGDDEDPGDPDGEGGEGDGGPGAGGPVPGPGTGPGQRILPPRPRDLIVPLLTLLGRAERAGEVQGFGLLDPALARRMAADAAAGPHTEICVTVTSREGYAIGHGCARPCRSARSSSAGAASATDAGVAAGVAPLARLNLTVPAAALGNLVDSGGLWAFSPRGGSGPPGGTDPPDGYGTWTLVLPDGRRFTVRLDTVPTFQCDHRHATPGYQPGGRLRHLVQVRDGTCTFPTCNRHAKESDFEHAVPYDQGGMTCACNAGARSRACHRVKQSPGWNVTQPRPGWHQWQAPSGRVYVQEPKRYLA